MKLDLSWVSVKAGLDRGLDYGLIFGLDYGLCPALMTTISYHVYQENRLKAVL